MVCGVCACFHHCRGGVQVPDYVGHVLQFIFSVVCTGLLFKTPNCNVLEYAMCFGIAIVVQTCRTLIFSVSIVLWLIAVLYFEKNKSFGSCHTSRKDNVILNSSIFLEE